MSNKKVVEFLDTNKPIDCLKKAIEYAKDNEFKSVVILAELKTTDDNYDVPTYLRSSAMNTYEHCFMQTCYQIWIQEEKFK